MKTLLNKKNLKILRAALVMGFVLTLVIQSTMLADTCNAIRQSVLRLHIIANSDSEADQALKLRVRDRLLKEGKLYLGSAANEQEALLMAGKNLDQLNAAAQDEIRKNGYPYDVHVELGEAWFDTRVYDDITLPAGEYEAVKVVIGEGEGKNWWCVMFPPMCVSAAEEVASDSEALEQVLDEQQNTLVQNGEKYKIKFKSVEIYETVKEKLKEWF